MVNMEVFFGGGVVSATMFAYSQMTLGHILEQHGNTEAFLNLQGPRNKIIVGGPNCSRTDPCWCILSKQFQRTIAHPQRAWFQHLEKPSWNPQQPRKLTPKTLFLMGYTYFYGKRWWEPIKKCFLHSHQQFVSNTTAGQSQYFPIECLFDITLFSSQLPAQIA